MILQLQNGELKIAGSNFADNQFSPVTVILMTEGRDHLSATCTGCMNCKFLPCSRSAVC